MRHHAIIPTNDHQTGHINRRVAAQINLRQGHWEFGRPAAYIVLTTCAMRMAGVFAIATSTIALRTGLLFRWLALTGFLVGLLSLFAVGPVPWLELAFPIWIFAININILAVSRSSRPVDSESNVRGVRDG